MARTKQTYHKTEKQVVTKATMADMMSCKRKFTDDTETSDSETNDAKTKNTHGLSKKGNDLAGNLEGHLRTYQKSIYKEFLKVKGADFHVFNPKQTPNKRSASPNPDTGSSKRICNGNITITSLNNQGYINVQMDEEALKEACIELCTVNGRDFTLMDDSGFQKIIDPILEGFHSKEVKVNAEKVSKDVTDKAKAKRECISLELKYKMLHIKIDCVTWLGRTFLGINAQFIELGEIHLRTLRVKEVFNNLTENNITRVVKNTLSDYGVTFDQIYSLTVDNGRNIISDSEFIYNNEIKEILKYTGGDFSEISENLEDIGFEASVIEALEYLGISTIDKSKIILNAYRCVSNTIHLVVNDALKESKAIQIFDKVRTLMKKLLTPALIPLLKRSNLKKPILDCVACWFLSLNMLICSLQFKEFCKENEDQYSELSMSLKEWYEVEKMIQALIPAKKATEQLCADQLSIGDMFKMWNICYLETAKINDPLAKAITEGMKKRETAIMDNELILAGLYLDPRFQVILSDVQKIAAQRHLLSLWQCLQRLQSTNLEPNTSLAYNDYFVDQNSDVSGFEAMLASKETEHEEAHSSPEDNTLCMVQIQINLFDRVSRLKSKKSVLSYWEANKNNLPVLYKLSAVVLGVPSCKVSLERLFSGLKIILCPQRSQLNEQKVDDIMILRTNVLCKK